MAEPKPPGKPPYVPVDVWTLRCLYNRSDYADRIANRSFVVLHHWESKIRENGSKTVHEYYGVRGEGMYVLLQWFEGPNGEILASGFKDPKQFYAPEDPADYHQHGGNSRWQKIRREPETILGKDHHGTTALSRAAIKVQRVYGRYRTCKCVCFGPVEARRQLARVLARQARASAPQ